VLAWCRKVEKCLLVQTASQPPTVDPLTAVKHSCPQEQLSSLHEHLPTLLPPWRAALLVHGQLSSILISWTLDSCPDLLSPGHWTAFQSSYLPHPGQLSSPPGPIEAAHPPCFTSFPTSKLAFFIPLRNCEMTRLKHHRPALADLLQSSPQNIPCILNWRFFFFIVGPSI
jgi:hypothetical protein